ncbi:unnamed protein product [Phyllotreta striolata]|uniref:Alpha-1,3/1,6-mannosyltransferase ALG2 n=1 Tax=Phyllotreta striolata TaxID=444603 RepID=A0A9N9TI08_PHYSR|nr:unnamed protein product [Phyllotreta striolata]
METEPVQQSSNENKPVVVILHEKIGRRKSDRYILNIALAYQKLGYEINILTTQFEAQDVLNELPFSDAKVEYCAWWIPKSLLGCFKDWFSSLKAICMAAKLIFNPPVPKPELVVLDVNLWALYLLKSFTDYKVFYVENFTELKNTDACYEHSKVNPSLLTAKWIKLADEVIVETVGFSDILRKSYPSFNKKPIVLYPSIDIGLWNEPGISIQRIIPDLMTDNILFLSIGKFRRSTNFRLVLDAFELFLELVEDKAMIKRFQLVLAGKCKSLDEKFYYNELMAVAKQRVSASQVTFLRQLPTVHEKTLIAESAVAIHPAKNDVFSDFVLKAMSAGKPIVACNKGIASKMLVHRVSGVVVDPEPKVFAVAMKKLIATPHLQVFLGDMAKEAFDQCYSFGSFCERISAANKKLAGSSSSIYRN